MTRNDLEKLIVDLLELVTKDELAAIAQKLPTAQRQEIEPLLNALVAAGKVTQFQARTIIKGRGKGLLLGTYLVLDKLGQGGFGTVFEAKHRLMGRSVALKLMHPDRLNNQSMVDRFLREVRAAAKLEDPHIVKAYDADRVHGTYFLAMELVKGKVLSDLVKENGPLPMSQALDYLIQSAKGLEYAHRQGVIHRDIKPSNLILDEKGCVRVLDMGLARLDTVEESSREQLTQAGTSLGTSDYMAPEQAIDSIRADQRSDIYSLGCTLYALLCAEVMFPSSSETKRLLDHQTASPPPLRHKRADAPPQLEAIYQKMVAKKPEDRYQTMVEVLKALESLKAIVGKITLGKKLAGVKLTPAKPTSASTISPKSPGGKGARFANDETGLSKLVTASTIRATSDDAEEIPVVDLFEPPVWKRFFNRQSPQTLAAVAGGILFCCVTVGWGIKSFTGKSADAATRHEAVRPITPEAPSLTAANTIASVSSGSVTPISPTKVEPIKVEPTKVEPITKPVAASNVTATNGNNSHNTPVVIFHDSFADSVNGAVIFLEDNNNKRDGTPKHTLSGFYKTPEGQLGLNARFMETSDSGFGGQPGCLRIRFDVVPKKFDFIGLKLGPRLPAKDFVLPTWKPREITLEDLKQTLIEFRYRVLRSDSRRDLSAKLSVRLEQNHSANYATRLQFNALECTNEWQLFSARFSDAGNVDKFLEYSKENADGGFGVIFDPAQTEGLGAGDQFEIDDLKFLSTSHRAVAVPTSDPKKNNVVLHYTFEESANATTTYNGEIQTTVGIPTYHCSMFGKPKAGSAGRLSVVIKEDKVLSGPDGQPGVFTVRIAERPENLEYVGFVLFGKGQENRFPISTWTAGQTTPADLEKTTLEFRHKIIRANSASPKPLKFGLRMEPVSATDPHAKSIRFMPFESSSEWRTHSVQLSTASNQEVFLDHINSVPTNRLSFTCDLANQNDLQVGDTIVIDDVKVLSK